MIGIGEHLLRFTTPETNEVLECHDTGNGSFEYAASLTEQSHGWITGILLALQLGSSAYSQKREHTDHQIYKFLTEQVFDRQPAEIQTFLLGSALLDELTSERCNQLLGRLDSEQLLATLLHNNLFVTEINPGVLRYHPLFREFLLERQRCKDPQRYVALAQHLAELYAAQGQWSMAFDSCILAGDLQAAQRYVAICGDQLYNSGRLETIERFFAVLPQDSLAAPLLCLKARVALDRGRTQEAQAMADQAELCARVDEGPIVTLLQALVARVGGRYKHAQMLAQQALEATSDTAHRAAALRTLGICRHRLGRTEEAVEALQEALQLERQRGDPAAIAKLQIDLGICHKEVGKLQAAENYYMHADAHWAAVGNNALRAVSLNSIGSIQHLTGRFQEANTTLLMALQAARDVAAHQYTATVLSSLGDLYTDLHLWEQAQSAYEEGIQSGGSAYMAHYLNLGLVRLLVRQGRYEAAAARLQMLPKSPNHHVAELLLQGVIACGLGRCAEAAQAVQQAIASLKDWDTHPDLARAYLLQAWVISCTKPADVSGLTEALEAAVHIADRLGNDLFLVAETQPMCSMLQRAVAAGWSRAAAWLQRQQAANPAEQSDAHIAAPQPEAPSQQSREETVAQPLLVVRTLGNDQIIWNGALITIGWSKAREVFYYLLAYPQGATSDALIEAIWPHMESKRGRTTFWKAIHEIRLALPPGLIIRKHQVYQIDRAAVQIDCDIEKFLQTLDVRTPDPEAALAVLDLYQGAYLPWSGSAWSLSLRTHAEQRYLYALHIAAEQAHKTDRHLDALMLYKSILAADPLDEIAHAGIIRCQVVRGNRAAAIDQYQLVRRMFDEELGLELGSESEIENLYRNILDNS